MQMLYTVYSYTCILGWCCPPKLGAVLLAISNHHRIIIACYYCYYAISYVTTITIIACYYCYYAISYYITTVYMLLLLLCNFLLHHHRIIIACYYCFYATTNMQMLYTVQLYLYSCIMYTCILGWCCPPKSVLSRRAYTLPARAYALQARDLGSLRLPGQRPGSPPLSLRSTPCCLRNYSVR